MKPDIRQALRVFYKVIEYGQRQQGEYRLGGLLAKAEQDGYMVVLRDDAVTLRIFFHNTFDLDFEDRAAWDTFQRRISNVDTTDYGELAGETGTRL